MKLSTGFFHLIVLYIYIYMHIYIYTYIYTYIVVKTRELRRDKVLNIVNVEL